MKIIKFWFCYLNSNLNNKQSKMMYAVTEISGTGYSFAYLPVPSGYFLVSAFLWSATTMGIVNINRTNDTTYTLVFNENTSTDTKYSIECIWTKFD